MKTSTTLLMLMLSIQLGAQNYWQQVSSTEFHKLIDIGSGDFYGIDYTGDLYYTDLAGQENRISSHLLTPQDGYEEIVFDGGSKLFLRTSSNHVHSYNIQNQFWRLETSGALQIQSDDQGNIWMVNSNDEVWYLEKSLINFKHLAALKDSLLMPRLFKGDKSVLVVPLLMYKVYEVTASGIQRTILLDSNMMVNPAGNKRAAIYGGPNNQFVFYPIRTKPGNQDFGIGYYDLNTDSWVKEKLYNIPETGYEQGRYYKEGTNELILIGARQTPNYTYPSSYMTKNSNEWTYGDFNSGLGQAIVHEVVITKDHQYFATENGVFKSYFDTLPKVGIRQFQTQSFKASFSANGSMFDGMNQSVLHGISAKDYSEFQGIANVISQSRLWLAAKNSANGELHVSADQFSQGDAYDKFYAGPISSDYLSHSVPWIQHVTQAEIDDHIANYKSSSYKTPFGIQNWPAHGFAKYGQAECLAPFVDVDGNGMYEPRKGDYPKIRGDQAIYCIYNDHKMQRNSDFKNLGVEVHAMYYVFEKHSDSRVRNTVFAHFELINRSNRDYDSLKVGLWTDFDLGCSQDDYVGSDPAINTYYAYNGDAFDEDCMGQKGFGNRTPVVGVTPLSTPLTGFLYHNTDQSTLGNPQTASDYQNYLNSCWKDGSGLVHGGTGHLSSGGSIPTKFMFSGTWQSRANWTEITAGNVPSDRRGVGSIGPFNLKSGEVLTYDIMFHAVWDSVSGGSVNQLASEVNFLKSFHSNQNYSDNSYVCSGAPAYLSTEEEDESKSLTVYPNPNEGSFLIDLNEDGLYDVQLLSLEGKVLAHEIHRFSLGSNALSFDYLPKGMYVLKLSSDSNDHITRIVIH